jgi:cytochrome d ubiquinol oxidase subunit I
MVGLGCLFILFFAITLFLVYKKDIAKGKWWMWTALILLPLGYVASESGWLVAEFGRQPWTIQDMMPTWIGVSDLSSNAVMLTFFIFLVLFTALLAVEINILCKQIKKGPEYTK